MGKKIPTYLCCALGFVFILSAMLKAVNVFSFGISFTHDIDAITYSLVSDNHITECVNIIYEKILG